MYVKRPALPLRLRVPRSKPRRLAYLNLVSEICETKTHTKVLAAQELDDRLKLISLFSGHPDLTFLNLALDLGIQRFNRFDNFLGLIALQALLDLNLLTRVSEW